MKWEQAGPRSDKAECEDIDEGVMEEKFQGQRGGKQEEFTRSREYTGRLCGARPEASKKGPLPAGR